MTTIANRLKAGAFTLSELLISLVLLGVIATFAVSKISQVVEENRRKAIFKEDFAAIYEIYHKVVMLEGRPQGDVIFALRDNLAYQEILGEDLSGQDKFIQFTMPNGSYLEVVAWDGDSLTMWVNYDAASPPNTYGEDILFVKIPQASGPEGRAHTIVPWGLDPENVQGYNDLWK